MQRHAWGEDELAELERRLRRLEADRPVPVDPDLLERLQPAAPQRDGLDVLPRPQLPPMQP